MKCNYSNILNPEKLNLEDMNPAFVDALDDFGKWVGSPIFINAGASKSGHSPRSKHYDRPASVADFYIPGVRLSDALDYLSEYMFAKISFGGIGAYPYWNNPGMHLDFREDTVHWYRDSQGKYHYYTDWDQFIDQVVRAERSIFRSQDFC